MIFRHVHSVVLKGQNIAFDGFADVHDGGLPTLTLGNAPGKTRALGHPKAIVTRIYDHLSHGETILDVPEKLNTNDSQFQGTCGNAKGQMAGDRIRSRIAKILGAG